MDSSGTFRSSGSTDREVQSRECTVCQAIIVHETGISFKKVASGAIRNELPPKILLYRSES